MGKRQRRRERLDHRAERATPLPGGLLDKVRALLAKAESTTFQPEAEAFTAKAQELMTRYRIDRAMLVAAHGDTAEVSYRRISVDDPYADARAIMLSGIATANSCHAVWCRREGYSTVFGADIDIDLVDELFTSLLVQATAAMRREGTKIDWAGRNRTRRFRRSFLVAFAFRIGDRLQEAVATTIDDAVGEHGAALVPLLAARDEAAAAAAESAFPDMTTFRASVSDGEGWFKGQLFAERADVATGAKLEPRSA